MRWPRKRPPIDRSPRDAWEAVARCVYLPVLWVASVAIGVLASVVSVKHAGGSTDVEFHVTSVTVVLFALLWLPTLLRVIALTGGNLKTPAGEASTGGFLEHFRNLPLDDQEESLSAAAAVADRVEIEGPPAYRANARRVREELEEAIADIPRSPREAGRRLREVATEYERLRAEVKPSSERTRAMTELMARARGLAASRSRRGDPTADPRRWYSNGSPGHRIVALAAVQARQDPRDLPIVIDAISHSASAFEQFHALRAAVDLLPRLDPGQRDTLARAVESQLAQREGGGRWITPHDQSRWQLAHWILEQTRRASEIP